MTVCLALLLARPLWAEDYAARVQAYLEAGRGSNLALQAASADVERAQAVLDEARARYRPSVSLSARYSRADGGRTQPLPVGDLVNPAYRTLNELLQAQDSRRASPTSTISRSLFCASASRTPS